MMIVLMEPPFQVVLPLAVRVPQPCCCPFTVEGLLIPFNFPVGLWPVAAGEDVTDPYRLDGVTEHVRAVPGTVVSHDLCVMMPRSVCVP